MYDLIKTKTVNASHLSIVKLVTVVDGQKNTNRERRMFSSHLNSLAQDLEDAVKTIMLYSVRDTDTKTAGQ